MQLEFENDVFRLYWYDTERHILITDVFSRWTWQDALEFVQLGRHLFFPDKYPKYSIIHFKDDATKLPEANHHTITKLRKIVTLDKGNEELIFFVGRIHMLKGFLRTASVVYNLMGNTSKYRYVRTFDDALSTIIQHQTESDN